MKKVFFSLVSSLLLLASCSNNETTEEGNITGTGELVFNNITFNGMTDNNKSARAASPSNAIPFTNWSNIEQIHLFLYHRTGAQSDKIAFSYVIKPTANGEKFSWNNIPVGDYRLALVANVKSSSDNIVTSIASVNKELDPYNVLNLKINDKAAGIAIDLKPTDLPVSGHDPFATGKTGYLPPSEIFTAYANVTITEGLRTEVDNIQLKRAVSLMRLRVNSSALNDEVDFENEDLSGIFVHRLPVGFNLPTGDNDSPLDAWGSTTSDIDRIMVAKTGVNTFQTTAPIGTHSNPETILNGFDMWQEFCVLPNLAHGEGIAAGDPDLSDSNRKYFIVISGNVPDGYEYADGTIAEETENPVYWSVTINKPFSENIIRELDITITSKGSPVNPKEPEPEGGLDIIVSAPLEWEAIYSEIIEI